MSSTIKAEDSRPTTGKNLEAWEDDFSKLLPMIDICDSKLRKHLIDDRSYRICAIWFRPRDPTTKAYWIPPPGTRREQPQTLMIMKRSKGGCITCRIRRVKCDETKPHCRKCQSAGRTCDGYAAGDTRMTRRRLVELMGGASNPGRPMAIALSASPSEITHFDLFRQATAPTAGLLASNFWQRDVLQLAQAEPAMWHATVAVGALQAAWKAELQGKDFESCTQVAMAHYGKALALARDLDSPRKMAALSLVLMASTNMLGRWSESQLHVIASLRMSEQAYADTVTRMDFQAMTYSDSASPYPFSRMSELVDLDRLLLSAVGDFASLDDATSQFFSLFRAYIMLGDGFVRGGITQGPFLTRCDAFLRALASWERCMERLIGVEDDEDVSLRMYHCFLRLLIHAGPLGHETRYDRCLGHFEYIVRLATVLHEARSSTVSLELGLIVPLYTTAHRCRHSALRHHALEMIRGLNCIEGNWRSDAAARVLDRVIAVEEMGLQEQSSAIQLDGGPPRVPWRAWSRRDFEPPTTLDRRGILVSDGSRVRDVCAMANLFERRVDLRLLMCSPNDVDPCGPVREDVAYF